MMEVTPSESEESEPGSVSAGQDQIVSQPAGPPPRPPRVSVEGAVHILGDRDAVLYFADDVGVPPSVELPDEFFEPRKSDVDNLWKTLQTQRQELDDAPLLTSKFRNQYREDAVLRNITQYPVSIIRVRFPNRYVLQGTFRTIDTIEAVTNFVKHYISNPALKFYLFTAPPRRVLPLDQRLVELGLVNCSVLYFGSDATGEVLRTELYSKISCPQAVFANVKKAPSKPALDPASMNMRNDDEVPGTSQRTAATSGQTHRTTGAKSGVVPKWFKTNTKK